MRRFLALFFGLFAAVLIVVGVRAHKTNGDASVRALPRNVVPATDTGIDLRDINTLIQGSELVSLIPLRDNEILVETLNTDFDGDGYDDQVNAVRRRASGSTASSGPITLIIGIYDPVTNLYRRVDEIDTGIAHEQSFSYNIMDMTGNHRNSLVYSGLAANGDYVMQVFLVAGTSPGVSVAIIGNFRTNGTIFIQQVDRYDTYEASRAAGASWPVWVYSQDIASGDAMDTVQTRYDWSPGAGRYVLGETRRVREQRHSSAELARIAAGGMDTLGPYLDGVWTQVNSIDQSERSVFFDYQGGELSFVYDDIQEIYVWSRNVLRRNGVYISAVNAAVANIQRQIEATLTGMGELSLRVQDDVRMNISENSLWDGAYRKVLPGEADPGGAKRGGAKDSVIALIAEKPTWTALDTGTGAAAGVLTFGPEPGTFVFAAAPGRYALQSFDRGTVIEFRDVDALSGTYAISVDEGTLVLQKVVVHPGTYAVTSATPLKFTSTS
jgi:hypothetical protein